MSKETDSYWDEPTASSARPLLQDGVYVERGGLRYGESYWLAGNFSWPFATLTASRDSITIDCWFPLGFSPGRSISIPRAMLKSITRKHGFFSIGMRFEHSLSDRAAYVLFWTSDFKRLAGTLESLGYSVGSATSG